MLTRQAAKRLRAQRAARKGVRRAAGAAGKPRARAGAGLSASTSVVAAPALRTLPALAVTTTTPVMRERGSELVTAGTIGAGDYAPLVSMLVWPKTLGFRAGVLSCLYEKYFVNSLVFRLRIAGNLTTAATFIMAYDLDVGDSSPMASIEGVKAMAAWRHHVIGQTGGSTEYTLAVRPGVAMREYYTSYDAAGDLRESYCGQLYLYTVNAPSGTAASYTLSVDYDLAFLEPQVETTRGAWAPAPVTGVTTPTDVNFWDIPAVTAIVNALANVTGITVSTKDGHVQLRLQPGKYYIDTAVRPTSSPSADCGIAESWSQEGVAGASASVAATVDQPTSVATWAYRRLVVNVPAGVIVWFRTKLYQVFTATSVDAWVSAARAALSLPV